MKKITYILMLLFPLLTEAQQKFIYEGRIEYERKINLHRQLDDEDMRSEWFKELIRKQPAFHTSAFSLHFKGDQTIYRLAAEMPSIDMPWMLGPAKENAIFTDIGKRTRKSQKLVYEQNFMITDSLSQIEWKITEEKRTIAGLDCRKAVGKICDSVYVVAFYTDEIPVSGGPESFDGLPGMILGVAIPRLHTTWFATKVQLMQPVAKEFEIAAKGTKTDNTKLKGTLKSSMKDWGKYGERNIWWVML